MNQRHQLCIYTSCNYLLLKTNANISIGGVSWVDLVVPITYLVLIVSGVRETSTENKLSMNVIDRFTVDFVGKRKDFCKY